MRFQTVCVLRTANFGDEKKMIKSKKKNLDKYEDKGGYGQLYVCAVRESKTLAKSHGVIGSYTKAWQSM
jgi:hypothetical protein